MGNQQLNKIKEKLKERTEYSIDENQDFSSRQNIISIHHNLCKKNFNMTIKNFLYGRTCTACHVSKRVFRDKDDALEAITNKYKNTYKNFQLVGEFTVIRKTLFSYECCSCDYKYTKTLEVLHNKNYGCTNCFNIKRLDTLETFKEKVPAKILNVIEIVGDYISHRMPIDCECLLCKTVFTTTPDDLKKGNGCKNCSAENKSIGHKTIRHILASNNIQFEEEKTFENCANIRPLPFDFFIESENTIIEFDGIQHFQPIPNWGGEDAYKVRVHNDSIKNRFCEDNGIKLIRIPYTSQDDIENILISSTTIPGTGVGSSDPKRTPP